MVVFVFGKVKCNFHVSTNILSANCIFKHIMLIHELLALTRV